jgi:phosphoribosylformylglycinamidine (FGAM) synthase PurS component
MVILEFARLADLRDSQPVTVRYQVQQKGYNDVEDMRVQH